MSRPRYWWWGTIKALIRQYPKMREAMQDQLPAAATARYGPQTPQNGAGRALEGAVVKRLSDREVQDYEAVRAAIRETAKMENGEARLAIIDLLYWKRYWKTIDGAAYEVGYSTDRAEDFHGEFIRLVGFYMGYLPREKVRRKRNVTAQSQKPVSK